MWIGRKNYKGTHGILDNIERNQTLVTEFLLLGLGNLHRFRIPLFIVFLIAHIMAITSNVLVITLVVANQTLHSPMYFFLSQLSLCEILFTSNLVPNMLWLIWLKFCDLDVINHFFCDIPPLVEISCSDTYFMKLLTSLVSRAVVPFPFLFIVVTYIFILRAILKIPSTTGRKKAFSTCSSHLIVVCTYYGTLSTVYILPPRENSVNTNKGLSLLYILVTPLFNPLVYSLRNQDIRAAAVKSLKMLSWQKL
ncbi:PREDICTED: olfactory receptor 10A3-like [Nanorana parkeri]|uniref:olfactory receptor 10A3-like n=1 Tax=Nanorana parkeri TaxID=125878 RepID=UPI0008543081|nr:PREDICTED: olfactory receptor 10A3-like [Nanorana parkeri]